MIGARSDRRSDTRPRGVPGSSPRSREQFGNVDLIDFQAIEFMLADMATEIAASKSLALSRGLGSAEH